MPTMYVKNRRNSSKFKVIGLFQNLCLSKKLVLRNRLLFIYQPLPFIKIRMMNRYFLISLILLAISGCASLKEYTLNKNDVKMEFVKIPSGQFTMGSQSNEAYRDETEGPIEIVTIKAFKMSKYEVTFKQYDLFCDNTGRMKPSDEGWGRGNNPVINVTYTDAVAFAEWMGCRLPTEAEWEYACRAETTTPFNTGSHLTTKQSNYNGDYPYNDTIKGVYRKKTIPVGSFNSNNWGLYDMHGNVAEWCSNWYNKDISTNPISNNASAKPLRGGNWDSESWFCRSASPGFHYLGYKSNSIGFRLVQND